MLLDSPLVWLLILLFSLAVGSFLNVVIYRLPLQLRRAWGEVVPQVNLAWPRSHCPQCSQTLNWWHNLPLISWLLLRGRCAHCHTPISVRYPLVELSAALLAILFIAQWGINSLTAAWILWAWVLLCLAVIDARDYLLPDVLTLPLMWAGLVLHWQFSSELMFNQAFLGVLVGYLSLWSVYWLFKLLTGKEGLGFGDFKLLAALGAWLGAPMLLPIILLAALSGLIWALLLKIVQRWQAQPIPFGPHLILAALLIKLGGWPWLERLYLGEWLRITQWAG